MIALTLLKNKIMEVDKDIFKVEDQLKIQEVVIITEDRIEIHKYTLNMDMETSFLLVKKLAGFKRV